MVFVCSGDRQREVLNSEQQRVEVAILYSFDEALIDDEDRGMIFYFTVSSRSREGMMRQITILFAAMLDLDKKKL